MKLLIIVAVIVIAVLVTVSESEGKHTEDVNASLYCTGAAKCFSGIVTKVIDGDTLKVNVESMMGLIVLESSKTIRFSLSSSPELEEFGGIDSKNFIETLCPVGSTVVVDEDDGQMSGSFGRIIGLVYCNDVILNKELLDANLGYLEKRFCDSSEFSNTKWALKHGC